MADWDPVIACVREASATRLRCWGDFALVDDRTGDDIKLRGRKTRALVAYLALHPGKAISRERLTGLLWGNRGEEQARASLRQAVLELKPLSGGSNPALNIERDHLTLHPSAVVTDMDEMRLALGAGDYRGLLALLPDRDERLFANLEDVDEGFDDWLMIERTRQHDALVTLVADASAAALAQGQTRHARALHARRLELDPAFEPAAVPQFQSRVADMPPAGPIAAEETSTKLPPARGARNLILIVSLVCALMAGAIASWFLGHETPDKSATIAVLPFRSLPQQDASFAEGLTDEITAQLARQPTMQVAGRTSADQFRDGRVSTSEIGRRLRVSYVLEGSVRSVGHRVRVTVALARASTGLQLWSQTFDGTLDDVLNIQYRIAASVAQALDVKLTGSGPPTGSLATNGQVYSLYLSARGLIRERNPQAFAAATEKLRTAVAVDPNFAPAWSSLAQAENPGGVSPNGAAETARAIAHAKKALSLAPDLAEAHGVLGMLYGFESPLGYQHIARAAALDPNNAEFQYWLGATEGVRQDYGRMLSAYRRAYALDPLWNLAEEAAITANWALGNHREALAIVRRVEQDGSAHQAHLARAVLARSRGEYTLELRELDAARSATTDPGRKQYADCLRIDVFKKLLMFDQAYAVARSYGVPDVVPPDRDLRALIFRGRLPTLAELKAREASSPYLYQDQAYVGRAAKMLINAGRARDVIALYDGDGIMQISHRAPPSLPARVFEDGPVVAAALRAVGRREEADRILAGLHRQVAATLQRNEGKVPDWFLAFAARTWAMEGKTEAALSALENATANGWSYAVEIDDSSLQDLGDEPAFRPLRGQPRFETIRARINEHRAAERMRAMALLKSARAA